MEIEFQGGVRSFPYSFAFGSNNLLAIGLGNGSAEVWDIEAKKKRATFQHETPSGVGFLAFDPEGKRLVSVAKHASVWELSTGKELYRFTTEGKFFQPTWPGKGDSFFCGDSSGAICVLNSRTGRIDHRHEIFPPREGDSQLGTPRNSVIQTRCSSDGRLVACLASDGEFALYSSENKRVIFRTKSINEGLIVSAFSPDNRTLYTTSEGDVIRRWDTESGKELESIPARMTNVLYMRDMSVSPNGKTITTLANIPRTWDIATGREVGLNDNHKNQLTAIAYNHSSGLLATGSLDQIVCVWDAKTGERRARHAEIKGSISCLTFLGTGNRLAVGNSEGNIHIWAENNIQARLQGHRGSVLSLAATTDVETLVSGGGGFLNSILGY